MLFMALTKMFRARWSADVHTEWIAAVVRKRPDLTVEKLQRTRDAMDHAVLDAVVTGYESLFPSLNLPDPDDRHVLAGAIRANASCIITCNLKDFPAAELEKYDLHVVHPDRFLLDLQDLDPNGWADAVRDDFLHYVDPPLTVADYAEALRAAGVPNAAKAILEIALLLTGE